MSFNLAAFQQMQKDYFADYVTVEIINYTGDRNPVGGADQGVNIDIGEVNSFDLVIRNTGMINLTNVDVKVTAYHGKVSGTFSGWVNLIGSQWIGPWATTWVTRKFNLAPLMGVFLKHETSGGNLFGYRADSTTGGTDNTRLVETLLMARIYRGTMNLGITLSQGQGPQDTFEDAIQRP